MRRNAGTDEYPSGASANAKPGYPPPVAVRSAVKHSARQRALATYGRRRSAGSMGINRVALLSVFASLPDNEKSGHLFRPLDASPEESVGVNLNGNDAHAVAVARS